MTDNSNFYFTCTKCTEGCYTIHYIYEDGVIINQLCSSCYSAQLFSPTEYIINAEEFRGKEMKLNLRDFMTISCVVCKKEGSYTRHTCGDCHDTKITIPEGWEHFPEPFNSYSYPPRMVCTKCTNSDEYKKAQKFAKKQLKNRYCDTCGAKKKGAFW